MHRLHLTGLSILLLAAASCGDDGPGPTVSDKTSWQIGCVQGVVGCSGTRGAHRADREDVKLKVKCSRQENGLTIDITDPGQDATSVDVTARPYGRLRITRVDPENNRCSVIVEEEEKSTGGTLSVQGTCGDDNDDACVIEGDLNKNGWVFDGTIRCEGLKENGEGDPDFTLQSAGSSSGAAAIIQIANCD